jgi:thiol-disulfide isomerase/thioredoxin
MNTFKTFFKLPAGFFQPLRMSVILLLTAFIGISATRVNDTNEPGTGIYFVENPDQIETLEQLVAPFKGKVVYIDLWATWCGPCRNEMKFSGDLKAFIGDKPVEVIYLSIDKPQVADTWKKMIFNMELKGHHLISNETLKNDILSRLVGKGNTFYIPRYVLVDKNGKIANKDAPRPSEKKKLYPSIESLL